MRRAAILCWDPIKLSNLIWISTFSSSEIFISISSISFGFCFFSIDFDDPSSRRAQTLAKSAVLAALEEEERAQSAQKPGEFRILEFDNLHESSLVEKKSCFFFCALTFRDDGKGFVDSTGRLMFDGNFWL